MDQTILIAQLWTLTQAIERAASLADWPQAARLTEERSPLFASLSAVQATAAIETIRRIEAVDAAVLAEAHTTQRELDSEYQAAMSRVQATSQYQRAAARF
jgi:hypothetical protein